MNANLAGNAQRLQEISEQIGKAIEQGIDRDNPDEVTGKLMELCALQSTATYANALAEQLYNKKLAELVQVDEHKKLSATDKKMLFAGLASQEIYYMTLCERYIKNLSYSIEALRSVLSWKKVEFEQSKYQTH